MGKICDKMAKNLSAYHGMAKNGIRNRDPISTMYLQKYARVEAGKQKNGQAPLGPKQKPITVQDSNILKGVRNQIQFFEGTVLRSLRGGIR